MTEKPDQPTILVVDDEEVPRSIYKRMLKENGFNVLVAASGAAALEWVTACGTSIDLVLLDLLMPDMSGEETYHALHQLQPNLPVLLCTGSDENDMVHRLLLTGYCARLTKPFPTAVLLERVHWMLAHYPRLTACAPPP